MGAQLPGPPPWLPEAPRFRRQTLPKVDWSAPWPGQLQRLVGRRALLRGHCVEEGQQLRQTVDRSMRGVGYCLPRIDQDRAKSALLCACNVLPWIVSNEYGISSIDIEERQCVLEDLRRRFPPADVDAEDGGIHGLRETVPTKLLPPSFG